MATPQQLRQMVRAEPFRPFLVKLAGGRSFTVRHPENVACSVNGDEMTVYDDHGVHLVEMLLVEVLEPAVSPEEDPPGKRRTKKKGQ
jgi:hypothetical protein